MDTFFGRYKNPLVLATVLVMQFFLLAVQVRRPFPAAAARVDQEGVRALRYGMTTVVTPPESLLHKGGLTLRGIWSSYLDLIGVREENAHLKEEIDQLRMEQAALAEDARQGERLEDLLAFRSNYINATVPAQVVGTSGTDRSRVLYLDKGSDDGIAADMPVITPDGIVGRVREVYPHAAQVLEISDPTSAAGVLLEETRTRGILRGNPQGQPQIVNLMPDDRIKPGQVVLTSGGDQIFPRGLPVGVVDHIVPDKQNEPMVDIVLKPAANLGRLEEVLVVTSIGPAPTDRARKDVSKSELMAAGARAAKEVEVAAQKDTHSASDVLAQRLPSRYDQAEFFAPDATPDASPATSEAQAKPLHPPAALHPDHYTPSGVPAAATLTPGQRYAPLVEGTPETERRTAKASAGDAGVNATDTAPVATNPAFAGAIAGMTAQRKALADARAADAARRYAATHPAAPVSAPIESTAAGETVRYTERVNADGTLTRVPVPGTGAAPGIQYTNRVNADGTVTRVPVPGTYTNRVNADGTITRVPIPAASGSSGIQYTNRVNADGTVTRVPVPGTYTNRVNADGTITRVPIPAASGSSGIQYTKRVNADGTITRVPISPASGATSGIQYTNRINADGTVTRVPVPGTYTSRVNADGTITRVPISPASGSSGLQYTSRVNADGTVTRVPVPGASATAAVRYVNRTNADGTVTRVPVPASPTQYTNRVNADGTVTRVPISSGPPAPSAKPKASPAPASVPTRVIADGPLPAAAGRAPDAAKRKAAPVLVPDDGSRPPSAQPPATPPQEQH
jgi:rod shape-determining protein MreC